MLTSSMLNIQSSLMTFKDARMIIDPLVVSLINNNNVGN